MPSLPESARGQHCTIRLPGICNANPETVVLCHLPNTGLSGVGMKPNDLLACFGCSACHDVIDGRVQTDMGRDQVDGYVTRGHHLTLDYWMRNGEFKTVNGQLLWTPHGVLA